MKCQHERCDCEEVTIRRGGKQYCSEGCANAEARQDVRCPCDHPDCAAA